MKTNENKRIVLALPEGPSPGLIEALRDSLLTLLTLLFERNSLALDEEELYALHLLCRCMTHLRLEQRTER